MKRRKYEIPTWIKGSPGAILKECLNESGLTQKDLAKKINMSEQFISYLVRGKTGFNLNVALKLEDIFKDIKAESWLELEHWYYYTNACTIKRRDKLNDVLAKLSDATTIINVGQDRYVYIWKRHDVKIKLLIRKNRVESKHTIPW